MAGFGADAGTQRFAVLGFPARHSLSPRMHRAAFRVFGMDATYDAVEVSPDRLAAELDRLHADGFVGLNLTAPLKERAAELAVKMTPEAIEAGAVNTLRREPKGWTGHATDGLGFESWVHEAGVSVTGARVLLLGAGGAARSIAGNLVRLAPEAVHVVSRGRARAEELAERMRALAKGPLSLRASSLDETPADDRWSLLLRLLPTAEVGEREARWWDRLEAGAAVLEANYADRASGARARAAANMHRFEDGLGLLLHQGARSFTFWTGRDAPIDAMREALRAER
jgi:shikimate dehydrogenase